MMKKGRVIKSLKTIITTTVLVIVLLSLTGGSRVNDFKGKVTSVSDNKNQLLETMERVADWQIENHKKAKFHDLDWTNATFYIGLMDFSLLSKDKKYYQWLKDLGSKYQWQPYFHMYIADDIAISQVYLDMYRIEGDLQMFNPTRARTEWVINHPSVSHLFWGRGSTSFDRWSWCDALFMAPPVYAQMYNITKDVRFLEFMDREFRATYDLLYDKEEQLFLRDYRFLTQREKNGKKVFWGRGNGWVVGGLVKLLKELPESSHYHIFYKKLFVDMCERISELQDEDGYWHASLLDTKAYPNPETSSSAFFVYALAYGINSGLLDKDKYLPVIEKGWKALKAAVFPNGKLGWVQPVGFSPENTTKETTEVYGAGAFLLAGSEVYKIND